MKRKELFNVQLLNNIRYKYAMSFGGWLSKPYNLFLPIEGPFHITHPQQAILEALNIPADTLRYSLPTLPEHEDLIDDYLAPYADKKAIVINPFASVDERSLTHDQLEKLVLSLAEQQDNHIFIVGEKKKLEKIRINHPAVSVCIFNSLWDTVALIKKALLVISVDTAIVHIACALDKKLIAIYYSMLLDHNKDYEGNVIFSPIGENATQLIFNKHNNKVDIEMIAGRAHSMLNEANSVTDSPAT
jgi:ADP-heptose:LPS heptosyltransferase